MSNKKRREYSQMLRLKLFCWQRIWQANKIKYRVFWLRQFDKLQDY